MAAAVRRMLRRRLRVDVHRVRPAGSPRITKSTLLYETDEGFRRVIDTGVARSRSGPTGDDDGSLRHRQRLYTLAQLVDYTRGVEGRVAECGCFRGLSSYVLCHYLREEDPGFDGRTFHIFDSFEGISALSEQDGAGDPSIPVGRVKRATGMFRAGIDEVRATLAEFPGVNFHPGWIPASFTGVSVAAYRIVHLDLDLHDPTRAALEYFYPLLAPDGVIVCDDHGSIRWPGARTAVEQFCSESGARLMRLSSGQALIWRPGNGVRPTDAARAASTAPA